ncbi:MAG: hypothetical protein GY934_11140 [Gammaproteobacteria bacterium]|nr:hypothetical protein [Gammaproteobacteria bacterium]
MMKKRNITAICLAGALFSGLFSVSANAFTVWAVDGGAASSSNTAGNPLDLSPGISSIDLYFDTEGDISWGWNLLLDVTGVGTVSGVTGGDINGRLGVPQSDGGWQQLGGDLSVDLNASSVLMFSFDFDAAPGALLSVGAGSIYSNGITFQSELITGGDLITVSAIPLPAAAWLFLGGMGFLGFTARRTAASA